MKIKIAVALNRINPLYLADFEKARLYYLKHLVDITFTFKNINVRGYTSVYDGMNWTLQGSQNLVTIDPTADVNMFVFDMGEWEVGLGRLSPNVPRDSTGTIIKPFINIGTYIADHNSGRTWVNISHEIMHSLVQTANLKGYKINDVLDSYYLNSTPDAPNGNFAQDWALLKPFLASYNAPTGVILTRTIDDGVETIGTLELADKSWGCKTLERSWRLNQPNISCIPKGTYTCKWTFSFKFLRYTYELLNVPSRSGIRIHSGNYFFDTVGCIILGSLPQDLNKDGHRDLVNSKLIVSAFEAKLNKLSFQLTIL